MDNGGQAFAHRIENGFAGKAARARLRGKSSKTEDLGSFATPCETDGEFVKDSLRSKAASFGKQILGLNICNIYVISFSFGSAFVTRCPEASIPLFEAQM